MLLRHGFLLPSLLFLSGAPLSAEILERIIVKVNGEILTQTEFQARQLAAAQAARVEPDRVGQFLRENNAKILQVQRAEDAGLRLPPHYIDDVIDGIKKDNKIESEAQFQEQLAREGMTIEDLKRNIERSIVRRQILSRDVEGKITVSESEARADYDRKIADYTKPPTVSLLEILV